MALPEYDVAVIGAGPAGVVAARCLVQQGWRVAVIDPCLSSTMRMETLPAAGVMLAQQLGLGDALAAACRGRVRAARLYWRAKPETRCFGRDGPWVLERPDLDRALRALVPKERFIVGRLRSAHPSEDHISLRIESGTVTARYALDARGRVAHRVRGQTAAPIAALGFTARLDMAIPDCTMLLHALAQGWLWGVAMPQSLVSGAVFLPVQKLAGLDAAQRQILLAQYLAKAGLHPLRHVHAGPVWPAMMRTVRDPFIAGRLLRIGDAALARDPIASHGLVHALRSGAQAAAAIATLLDPAGDNMAAKAFLRDRHRDATHAARRSTAQAYADQSRHRGGFWTEDAPPGKALQPPSARLPPDPTSQVGLTPLRRLPALEGGRIRWRKAIWLARSQRGAAHFGGFEAEYLAGALFPPASIAVQCARLETLIGPRAARALIDELLFEEALLEEGTLPAPQPISAFARRTSAP